MDIGSYVCHFERITKCLEKTKMFQRLLFQINTLVFNLYVLYYGETENINKIY